MVAMDSSTSSATPNYSQQDVLLAPFTYLVNSPGKAIRSKLLLAFNHWFHVKQPQLDVILQIVEMLHCGSLLIDDIEDDSVLRRGQPVAHRIFGVPYTLNTANYIYFLALQKVQLLEHPNAVAIYTDELLNAHVGQGLEIYWRDHSICPTETEYLDMVSKKTSALMRLGVRLLIEHATELPPSGTQLFLDLCTDLGQYFQIRDDYMNLTSDDLHKGFCDDIQEGKFSYPIIHSLSVTRSIALLNILKQRSADRDLIQHALNLILSTNSLKHTLDRLSERDQHIFDSIVRLGGNPDLVDILVSLRVHP